MIVFVFFVPVGLFVFGLFFLEIWEERKFFKRSIQTEGKVIRRIPAKQTVFSQTGIDTTGYATPSDSVNFQESSNLVGYFAVVEFAIQNGDVYEVRSKQVIKGDKPTLSVHYDPDDLSVVAIDGFYKVGNVKYINASLGLLLATLVPYVLYYLSAHFAEK